MNDERLTTRKVETPAGSDTALFASVLAVAWAIVMTAAWALLAIAFGRSKSNLRLLAMLFIGAVTVAFLCGHAYRHGWRRRR